MSGIVAQCQLQKLLNVGVFSSGVAPARVETHKLRLLAESRLQQTVVSSPWRREAYKKQARSFRYAAPEAFRNPYQRSDGYDNGFLRHVREALVSARKMSQTRESAESGVFTPSGAG